MAKTKFTCSAQKAPNRGTPEFERQYLLRMGYLRTPGKPAKPATEVTPSPPPSTWSELEQLHEVISCCEYLLPVAEAGARPGNAPEAVAAWLRALAATAGQKLHQLGGMGAVAPMDTKVLARN